MKRFFHIKESVRTRFPLFFISLLGAMLGGCEQTAQNDKVIARVNGTELTQRMIREQTDSNRSLSDADTRQFVNRWVTNELLFQEARQKGYDESESTRSKVEEARKQLSIAELLENEVYAAAERSVKTGEIAAYYQSHSSDYMLSDDLIRLSIIIFNSNSVATRFRSSALGSAGWDESVNLFRLNEANGVVSHSDSLFFTRSSLYPPELWKVSTALGMFEVSFPVNTSIGYVIMRSLGQFRKGTLAPIHYIQNDILHRVTMERRQQRYQEFIQQLRNKHTVQYMHTSVDSNDMGEK